MDDPESIYETIQNHGYKTHYGKTQKGLHRKSKFKEALRRVRRELPIAEAKERANKMAAKKKMKRPSRAKRRPCEMCGVETQRKFCDDCRVAARIAYDRAYAAKYREKMLIRQAKYRAGLPKAKRFCVSCGVEVGAYKRYCAKCRKY